jgi:hypothetical protein
LRGLFAAAGAFVVFQAAASAESFELQAQESEDLRLLYIDPTQTYLAPHVARTFINAIDFQKRLFDWEPWEKTTVLLMDLSDYGNGAAFSSPSNGVHLEIAPVSRTFEAFVASERIYSLVNHETVHVAALDVWNRRDAFWRRAFFGKPMPDGEHPETVLYNFLATPRVNAPRWYHEGSAVFLETWMAGGLGRAQGAYDEMVFRSMVRDGAHFYGPLGLLSEGTEIDFRGMANAYLYGTRFFNYLAYSRSPEKVVEWLSRGPDSKAYYSSQFRRAFGEPLNDVWDDWIDFEREFQEKNLDSVNQFPTTKAERLSSRALGSISRAFYVKESNSLIAAFRYPGVVALVGELDLETGDIRRLADVKGSMPHRVASLAYDPERDIVWYTTDNYAHRDIVEIDVKSGRKRTLLRDARIGDLAFNPADKSLWGVRHLNGVSALVRIPAPYEQWTLIRASDFGNDFFDLDISPDGALLAMTVGETSGRQTLKAFSIADLEAGEFREVLSYQPGAAQPEGAAFSPDGKHLYFSSYYTGVSNIFRLDLETHALEAVSNAETGYFRPMPQDDGSLIAFEYTGEGFTPVRFQPAPVDDVGAIAFLGAELVKKHPVLKTWAVGSPRKVDLEKVAPTESRYKPRRRLRLGSLYPVVEGYKDNVAAGIHVNIEDPAYFNQVDVTLSYSPGSDLPGGEKFHADIRYQGLNWRGRYWHNDADFYDLFGPTKRARKGDAFIIGYEKALIYDSPRELRAGAEIAYYTDLDALPVNQNIASGSSEILATEISLHYTNETKSLGSVDHEKGWGWEIVNALDRAGGDTIHRLRGRIDVGFALPIANSSVWVYNAGGLASGNAQNPLASFYFGGFKNNYVDDREVKRYREYDTMPGFEIDEIPARNFAKSVVEWNLPPLRFESVGAPSLYIANARTAIFVGALLTNPAGSGGREVFTAGAQVDFNFTLAHRLPMTLSAGFASGFESGRARSDEFLISLKIM